MKENEMEKGSPTTSKVQSTSNSEENFLLLTISSSEMGPILRISMLTLTLVGDPENIKNKNPN